MKESLPMAPPDRNCIKCAGVMEPGFIADYTYGDSNSSVVQTIWVRGEFKKSWIGAKISKNEKFLITTLRCNNCGYLESFATEEKK